MLYPLSYSRAAGQCIKRARPRRGTARVARRAVAGCGLEQVSGM